MWSQSVQAQHAHAATCATREYCLAGTATGLFTHVAARGGRTFDEGNLTQPMVMANARFWHGRLEAFGIYNFEGYSLERGELSPGTYGEGYIDRRHPHTHVHELMLGTRATLGSAGVSLFTGKGIVPFGSADPMMRPFTRYTANHHLAQILERAQIVAAARLGRVTLEASSFNGDEPENPRDWPNGDRLFDSWAARATMTLAPGLEASASVGRVKSPEDPAGFGLNQNKWAAHVRYSGPTSRPARYAMIEWAKTTEWLGPRKNLWSFASGLFEGAAHTPIGDLALRLERTSRPEEQRDRTPFRSVRPLLDFGILGRTLWESASVRWARDIEAQQPATVQVTPFIEVSSYRAQALERVVIVSPKDAFGGLRLFSFSAGVRVGLGAMRGEGEMGRYGVAITKGAPPN